MLVIRILTLTIIAGIMFSCPIASAAGYNGQRSTGCNTIIHLELGESFTFQRFPPADPGPFVYGYGGGRLGSQGSVGSRPRPRECSWTFMAVGECLLVYENTHFERGDLNCEAQYLLIGDENKEKRVCGFGHPERRLNSTGTHLFFTPYTKHSFVQIPKFYIGGVVTCQEVPPAGPPPPPPCETPTQECFDPDEKQCFTSGHCQLQVADPPPARELTSYMGIAGGHRCVVHWQYCHSSVPLAQTCPVNLTVISPISGTFGCTTHDIRCTIADPNCERVVGIYKFSVDQLSTDSHPCSSAGRLCTRRALFCFSRT